MKGLIILVEFFFISVLVGLQFLRYAFLPAIDPKTANKEGVAISIILEESAFLFVESIVALCLLYFIVGQLLKEIPAPDKKKKWYV